MRAELNKTIAHPRCRMQVSIWTECQKPSSRCLNRGDLSVELFAPHEVDTQQPHEQDEIYIIAAGSGIFRRGADRVPFVPGDFLFVGRGRVARLRDIHQ